MSRIDELAEALIDDHSRLQMALISRRNAEQLSVADVAERMGTSEDLVVDFERYDSNPTLATIRRYALAVGAGITTSVARFDGSDEIHHAPNLHNPASLLGVIVGLRKLGYTVEPGTVD